MALQYKTTKEHTITVTGYEGTVRHLVIPDQVDGCPVKTIGKNAFSAREDLECKYSKDGGNARKICILQL